MRFIKTLCFHTLDIENMSNNRVHDSPPPFYNWQVFSISLSHTITYIYLFASPTAFTPNSEQVWQAWVYLIHCALASARLLRRNILSCVYESECDAHDRMTTKLRPLLLTSSSINVETVLKQFRCPEAVSRLPPWSFDFALHIPLRPGGPYQDNFTGIQ